MAIRDLGLPPDQPDKPRLVGRRKRSRWQKVLLWTGGILVALIVVIAVGIWALLRSSSFHNYVLRVAEEKAGAALNTRVTAQNFAVHLHNLGLDLYGVTVYGVGPGANQPLLQVSHIGLGVQIVSVLHRQWNLDRVTIDHPVVDLIVNAKGENNIPAMQSTSNSNAFDLAIKHILIDRGSIYFNDQETPLYADLHNLKFQSTYSPADGGQYSGTVSYNDGELKYGNYAPMPHDLRASFDARRSGMTLSKVTLKSGQSQAMLNASLDNYSNPKLHANYVMILDLSELKNTLRQPTLPAGVVLVNGTADYAKAPGRSLLDSASLQGSVRSSILRVRTPTLNTDVRDLGVRYHLANGNADLQDITAKLLGGAVTGHALVRDISGKQQGQAVLALHDLSLADLKAVANSASLKPVTISGLLNANTEATWTGTASNLIVRADATAKGNFGARRSTGAVVPIDADVHALYNGQTQQLALNNSYLRMPQTSIDLNGTVSKRSALQVRVHSNDLHELETVADLFSKPGAQPLNLHGTATFDGSIRGTTSAPQIAGQLTANNLEIRGSQFRLIKTAVQASPSQVSLQNGVLDLGKQGHVNFNVQSGLHDWSHQPNSPFDLNLSASQLSLEQVAQAANVTTPLSGTLNANIAAHGTELNPIGQGNINLRNANISGESIQSAQVRFQGTGDEVHSTLLVKVSAGTAQGQLTYYPKNEGYDAMLQATDIQLAKLQILHQSGIQASGTLNLTASGKGTLKDPEGTATVTIPQLDIAKRQIRDIRFQGSVANHEATFDLGSQISSTPLRAQGKVTLTGDYYADLSLDTPVIPLQPLLATYAPAQAAQVSGQTEIHATLRGPLKNKALLTVHLDVPTLAVNYRAVTTAGATPVNLQIAAVTPIRADYVNGVVTLQPGEIKGTDTDIRYQGNLPLNSNAPSTLNVQGGINLAIAEVFDPTLATGGRLEFDINAAARNAAPNVEGQIRIVNASFSTPDLPIGVSNGNGVLTLRRDRLDITKLTANVGGGTVTASGGVVYRPAIQFNLGLRGSDLRMLYPQTVRTDFGVSLTMTGTTSAALLAGQVNINRISFTPNFDLTSFMNQFNSVVAPPPPTQGLEDNLNLNIAVRSANELNVVSPTLSIQGDANLRVVGTAANPVILGRADLTGGDVLFLGNRYVIQGGTIAFLNSIQTEPVVNLTANTTIQQYNIAMHFRGPMDRLQTTYTSDPALAQADIIHLIAFGNTEEAANAAPSQSTALGAESLIASQVSSQLTGRLQKALGVSQISLDPQLGASTADQQQGARLTVRQRVTSKLYVTFSTDVTTTQFSAIQVQYQLNRKWSVSGVRDENGGFSLDGRFHKEF